MTCALKASASDVFITEQDTEGQVNSNPVWSRVRRTDGRLTQQNTFEKSSEVKSNLQGQKNALTDVTFNNTFSVELTQNFIKSFSKSVLMPNEDNLTNTTSTGITFNSTTNTIVDTNGSFVNVVAGQWIFITGATDDTLNKPYYVTNKVDDNNIEVVNVPADESAGATISIVAVMLRSGNTPQLLSAQGRDPKTGATNDTDYKTQIDAVVDAMSFATPDTGLITGSATLIAATQLESREPIVGQTDAPDDTSEVLGSAMDFAGFYPDQADVENDFLSVTIDIVRNTGTQNAAGKLGAKCVAQDIIGITGSLVSLRREADPNKEEDKFNNQQRFSMSFGFEWPDGKFLIITMRKMLYTAGETASAAGDFANFSGTYDAEEDEFGTTIQFDTNITV